MSDLPGDLLYTTEHEWLRREDDGTVTVGITDHAQAALGDLVFVEVPETGRQVATGDAFAVVESVKAASDVYSPLTGEVLAGNDALASQPELVNQDPYVQGWIARLKPASTAEVEALLDAAQYSEHLASEA